MKKTKLITSLLAVAASLWLAPRALAADEDEGPTVKIPDTVAGVWQEITNQEAELSKIIADKKLDEVHHHAFAIRDLVNALPEKSKDLATDKLGKLKQEAKFVSVLASRLDESGDAKDQSATEDNFKKLQGVLKQIRALYPDITAKSSAVIQYTCPMHPDVIQDSPGNCPQCGMRLVVKK